jgi:hypothetical protein
MKPQPIGTPDKTNRELIVMALGDRARMLRRAATDRSNAGPAHALHRSNIRAEASRCDHLARDLGAMRGQTLTVNPETLI